METLIEAFLLEFQHKHHSAGQHKKHTRNRKRHYYMVRHGAVKRNVQRKEGYKREKGHYVKMSRSEMAARHRAANLNALKRRIHQKQISHRAAKAYKDKSKRNVH